MKNPTKADKQKYEEAENHYTSHLRTSNSEFPECYDEKSDP